MKEEAVLQRAVRWAAKLHRGQDREGAVPLPYVTHPIDVMCRLRYIGGIEDLDELAAAALHDVVEECGVTLEEIEERFGQRVGGLVRELTRQEPTQEQVESLGDEEVAQLRSTMLLEEIDRMSPTAQRIKLADRASNLTSYLVTRKGPQLERYIRQSFRILEVIPKQVSPPLWEAVRALLPATKP